MGFSTGNDAVARVKARLNIVDVVQRYVPLKRMGHRWVAPCPFHHETKPSFSVNEEEGFFYCFGCQEKGDVISFYSKINGLEFKEALTQLAREAGVELDEFRRDPGAEQAAKEDRDRARRVVTMHRLAAEHFVANLHAEEGAGCRQYLQGRGLSEETVAAFGLGYSLPGWHGLRTALAKVGIGEDEGVEAGLLKRSEQGRVYDLFRGRLMFPIQDAGGKVVAFGARLIDGTDGPKYINSTDTPIYKKGEHLFGLAQARRVIHQFKKALLTEGYLDVITLHQHGYANAVGVLGTALTPEQVTRLASYASHVELLFDGDAPGRKAALRSARMLLLKGLGCSVTLLPQGEDADSLLKAGGTAALEAVRQQAHAGLDFCLTAVRETESPKEIVAWAKEFLEALDDPAQHAYYLPRILEGLGLEERAFRKALGEFSTQQEREDAPQHTKRKGAWNKRWDRARGDRREESIFTPPDKTPSICTSKEEQLMRFALCFPDAVPELQQEGAAVLLTSPWAVSLWNTLCELCGQQTPECPLQADALLDKLEPQQRARFAEAMVQYDGYCISRETNLEELKRQIALHKNTESIAQLKMQLGCSTSDDSFAALRKIQEIRERELSGRNDG
ncbi:DNA primase [Megalodesulfovibrio gigas]|uniref:DNA primase n=1 Tax=Megalodesulfovibrio gigas (strain ATCC 19364 / DSM 1382 / NCIMB 9332 / VKM B-1759) TaxID=1121448 RepID=T2GDQ0_MEGG1|nr:DNA primase [Megalodesulfovibrio gigas]AGW14246.1 putative DNA primase [Megalodesulfovibrio gigas DSM 1382 = ATCC 19364]